MSNTTVAEALGVSLTNPALLQEALTHRSYLNEHREFTGNHNERLEFLGDAVLELAITDFLYKKFPTKPEGELTSYRAALVNTQSLARLGEELGLDAHLLLSRGEAKDTGRARDVIRADAVEAIIGALYLDQGYSAAEAFIAKHLYPHIDRVITTRSYQDAKSRLQELAQERRGNTPTYSTLSEEGPAHARVFTVGVYIGGTEVAVGSGQSKQEAEQAAADRALKTLQWAS